LELTGTALRDKWPQGSGHDRNNNFDVLRFTAASSVILHHSYALLGLGEDPASQLGFPSIGRVAVAVFFVISGYLVTQSWDRDPRLLPFVRRRAVRILPALVAAVLFCAFVVGPMFTSLRTTAYLANSQTWRFTLRNCLVYPIEYTLPGVFSSNPYPFAVNGSLWTLAYETSMYGLVAGLGLTGLIRGRRGAVFVTALAAAATLSTAWVPMSIPRFPSTVFYVVPALVLRLAPYFLCGSALYVLRDKLPLRWDAAAVLVMAALVGLSIDPQAAEPITCVAISYSTLVAAFAKLGPLSRFGARGDFSYGIYIFAFPVQQMLVVWMGRDTSPIVLTAVAFVLTLALAIASWFCVEKPCLRWKSAPRALIPTPAPRS
jgi:peptidoglycan/LPS O-acetylase OafA/YrhL